MATTLRMASFAVALLCSAGAAASPYETGDPEPVDRGKWEVLAYTAGERSPGLTEAEAGIELNYGLFEEGEVTLGLPFGYSNEGDRRIGRGDAEIGLKYRFVHEDEHGIMPDISFAPALAVPTGVEEFSSKRVTVFLPLWAQKNFGGWHLFGGGGWGLNPGEGSRNYWLGGIGLTRDVGERLNLGAELYHQTADEVDGHGFTRAAVGAEYQFHRQWSLLASVGRGLQHARETGRFTVFLGLQFNN